MTLKHKLFSVIAATSLAVGLSVAAVAPAQAAGSTQIRLVFSCNGNPSTASVTGPGVAVSYGRYGNGEVRWVTVRSGVSYKVERTSSVYGYKSWAIVVPWNTYRSVYVC